MNEKRLAINLIASFVGFGVNAGINFILSPYIISTVGTAAYGFVSLGNNFISYISIITLALTSMAGRFITIKIHEKNEKKISIYFNSVLIANIFMSIIVGFISIIFISNINKMIQVPNELVLEVKLLFLFLFMNFIISTIGSTFSVATFSQNRLDLSSIRAIEANMIKAIILVILFCFFSSSIVFLGLATVCSTIYIVITNIYYTNKLTPNIKLNFRDFSLSVVFEIMISGVWNVFNKISSILSTGLDLLIANLFVGPDLMGILSISKVIPNMILSLFGTISNVFAPQLTICYANKNYNEIKRQLLLSIKLLGIISSIPMALLFVFGDNIYKVWVPNQDAQLLHFLSIIICIELIFVLPLEPLWNIFTITNKLKISSIFLFINSFLSILIVFICLCFIDTVLHRLIIIAGVSTIFSIFRALIFLPIYGAKCLKFNWYTFYPSIFKNIISFFILSIVALVFKNIISINSWMNLIIISILIGIIGLIINYFLILNKIERKSIITKINQYIIHKFNITYLKTYR